jgi:hypothetical protein
MLETMDRRVIQREVTMRLMIYRWLTGIRRKGNGMVISVETH